MGFHYTASQTALQEQFDSRPLAAAVEQAIVGEEIEEHHKAFIESRDFFFLATVDGDGAPTVSYKGGDVGVVKVVGPRTLVFPNYDGNGMFLSMGNIAETARIGLLFIDLATPNRVRVQATARCSDDDPLLEAYPGANLLVRAEVDSVFLNCARYIHKHERVATSPYVPDASGSAPYPTWKRIDGLQGSLKPEDRGRAEAEGGVITMEDYGQALAAGES